MYILIILIFGHSATTAEFTSLAACQEAQVRINAADSHTFTTCTPKGK